MTRSLRFLLDSRSRLGRMERRVAGKMADARDMLTGGVRGCLAPCSTDQTEYADRALMC